MELQVDFTKVVVGQEMVDEAYCAVSTLAYTDRLVNKVIDL